MATISNLVAKLRADTSAFDRKITKSSRHMKSFHRDVTMMGRQMRTLTRRVMIAAGITGLGYLIKQTMQSIDATAKMSDELRISTKAITGWEHAAKISGTSLENLHKGLEIFVRRMGEAKQGLGEGQRGLEALNLSANELISMGTEKAFLEIADRISKMGTAAEQAATAYQFFGRQGVQLLNMFQQGKVGIEALTKEAEKLGLTFSRLDAAQVEAAVDSLTRARAVMTGLVRQATIQLSPYIETLANKFVDVATAGDGVGANVVNAFESISLAAIKVGSSIQGMGAYWKAFEAGGREALATVYDIADAATNLDVLFKKLGMSKWRYTYKELAQQQRQIAAGLLEEGGAILAGTSEQENAVKRFYEGLKSNAENRRVTLEAAAGQRAGVSPLVEDTTKAAAQIKKHTETIADHWYRAARRVQTSMGDALEGVMANVHNTKDMFKEFTISIAKSMRMAIADMAAQWIMFQTFTGIGRMVGSAMFTNMGARIGNPMAPVTEAHRGGIAGQITQRRMVPAAAFMGAPRLHEGFNLGQYEMPAIIDKRETILPPGVGMQMPSVNIEINNESGVPLQQRGNPIVERDKIVILIEAQLNDRIQRNAGPLRNTIENIK